MPRAASRPSASAQTTRVGAIQRNGSYTVTWEEGGSCLTVNGTWSTGVGSRSWSTTATDLAACEGSCLEGTLSFERADAHYSLTFQSSGQVQFTTASGESGTISGTCGQ